MLKQQLYEQLATAIQSASADLGGLSPEPSVMALLKWERPRQVDHGDYAVNVSPLAKLTRMPPPKIADALANAFRTKGYDVTVLGGFLNIRLSLEMLLLPVVTLAQSQAPGKNDALLGEKILLEYVSANPTGPLHIGHGRWAALGDSLIRIFRHSGALASPEFYVNDAGVQMGKIAITLFRRTLEILHDEKAVPDAVYTACTSEELPYPGEYVVALAQDYLVNNARKQAILEQVKGLPEDSVILHEQLSETLLEPLKAFCREKLLAEQVALMETLGVRFDRFFSEKEDLYARNLPETALKKLRQSGKVYEQDGAVWFKTTDYGDEKDRVLKKSDGSFTYLTPDIAYHDDKFSRKDASGEPAYNRIINIWGADHHGYIPRVKAAIEALGHPVDQFEVLLGQLVNLIIDGEKTRMGKRRKMLTLADVVDEVGVDATRLWMVWKPAETALDFDVDLATSTSHENPVFYVQYAHARCCSILRNATESQIDTDSGETLAPKVQPQVFEAFVSETGPTDLLPLFNGIADSGEASLNTVKSLLLKLDGFDDIVADAARIRSPHLIARYAVDLSAEFHAVYQICRMISDDQAVTLARLTMVLALKKTLAQALSLLGVSAPERM
ncbi:MAG: arginine--tRNA ligase [Vampirovibrionales bacterium]|nr:arginine--tRNA ligase [Vampirovibrionales bacterium]